MTKPVPHKIEWIVNLLKAQHPDEIEVAKNLELCNEDIGKAKPTCICGSNKTKSD